ncbi:sucrose-6-phosphate hydrolase [uncultured Trichococcus sp.]|uniref:glycoside hydrolase family 32 protein n=1 Tax=uncultured Trichococcus sp. TaxID=189665 RepID=UPI0029C6ADD6|nr:sucrose-6-phosphate hydrolase [uncultured Trichococcus sp.]
MELIDFSNRQNRFIREDDVSDGYIEKMKAVVLSDNLYYPSYHIAPPHGLLNDPNGLYQDNLGIYHIFHQWFPLGTVHGLKSWRHLTTADFVHYSDHGVAVEPNDFMDCCGCYTGMALKDKEDIHFYYTGIRKEKDSLLPSTVHAILKDDRIEKLEVIEDVDFTKTTDNFRDPFVYRSNEKYYMITGGESPDSKGVLLFSEGDNPFEFVHKGMLKLMDYPFGYMLECPNYFEEDAKGVLIFSPQGIESVGKYDFRNVFSVVYAVGEKINTETLEFKHTNFYELDKGFDFYAPQIFKDNQDRQILIGWLGNSKTEYPSDKFLWAHMLTLPREITIINDRISQSPLPEVNNLREYSIDLSETAALEKAFELEFLFENKFTIKIINKEGDFLEIGCDDSRYWLDRSHTTHLFNEQYGQVRYAKKLLRETQTARIFVDHSSIECFFDDGVTVFTGRFYLDGDWALQFSDIMPTCYKMKNIVVSA